MTHPVIALAGTLGGAALVAYFTKKYDASKSAIPAEPALRPGPGRTPYAPLPGHVGYGTTFYLTPEEHDKALTGCKACSNCAGCGLKLNNYKGGGNIFSHLIGTALKTVVSGL